MIKLDDLKSLSHVIGENGTTYAISGVHGWDGPAFLRTASGRQCDETVRKVCKRFRAATPEEIEEFAAAKASCQRGDEQRRLRNAREDAERLLPHITTVRDHFSTMDVEALTQLFLSGTVPWRADCERMARMLRKEGTDE